MAKNYAIMRIAKLSSNNDFARAINHNFRNYENTPGVHKDGVIIADGVTDYKVVKENLKLRNQMIKDATGHEVRKNRVRGFELLFAVNQDFMSDNAKRDEYFKLAKEWCIEKFGESNYLNSCIHLDEDGAAHMHLMVTCLTKDPKNITNYYAKEWVNGRESLSKLQDEWHKKVEHLGLERGKSVTMTGEHHKTKQEYVKLLQKDLDAVSKLSEHERNLLAVKGLRQERKLQKISDNIRSYEAIKQVDFEALSKDLIKSNDDELDL